MWFSRKVSRKKTHFPSETGSVCGGAREREGKTWEKPRGRAIIVAIGREGTGRGRKSKGETERKREKKREGNKERTTKFSSLDTREARAPRSERERVILVRLRFQEVRLEFRLRGAPTRIWNASVVGLVFDSLPARFSGATLRTRDCTRLNGAFI